MQEICLFWHRRDLRVKDNAGLFHALKSGKPVLPIFIFDTTILNELANPKDPRVHFIHHSLAKLHQSYKEANSGLPVFYGNPEEIFETILGWNQFSVLRKKAFLNSQPWLNQASQPILAILDTHKAKEIHYNEDYEPYARKREGKIKRLAGAKHISLYGHKDQLIYAPGEITKEDGTPYAIYTPFMKKWKTTAEHKNYACLTAFQSESHLNQLFKFKSALPLPTLADIGFQTSAIKLPEKIISTTRLKNYGDTRNIPSNTEGTSQISVHLRFGTISPRLLSSMGKKLNETYLNELIWREFYAHILSFFPRVVREPFRVEYDKIAWSNDHAAYERWCQGKTGFPIVDAGMRELNTTGHMHNRVRMIAASFLVKDLLIDYRWGETYFAQKLLDFDLASNNGNWQWVAGTGCDAAPYFRIFNPDTQLKKFDPDLKYVKRWVPEYNTDDYPQPMVDHKVARTRVLEAYKTAKLSARTAVRIK